jgi:class 3 adenylate cyclase
LSDRSRAANALAIMMTDVVGSTALRRSRGDRDADEILGLQAAIVRDEVRTLGGHVSNSLGDGFLISFPSTVAAVRAAVAIQQALQEHNATDAQRAVQIRIGIHAGPVSERDNDLQGQTVNAVSRVVDKAVGGQILTSDEVRKHAESLVEWSFLDSGLFLAARVSGALAALRSVLERYLSGCPAQRDAGADGVRRARGGAGQPAPAGRRRTRWPRRPGASRRRARRRRVTAGG